MLLTAVSLELRIPEDHPIRKLRKLTDQVLLPLLPGLRELYSDRGRKGIPPEFLLRALILQAVFSVRSERQLCEQLNYNLLFRWFVGMDLDTPAWDPTTFTKNRARLIDSEAGQAFLASTVHVAERMGLLQDERFVVDGSLLKAYASMKSFKRHEDDPDDFTGTKRSNATHRSQTDPDARLMRKGKGQESKLSHLVGVIAHGASGIIHSFRVGVIGEQSEVDLAMEMAQELPRGSMLAADKGFDCNKFTRGCRVLGLRPHPSRKSRGSSVDGRTTRHLGYQLSMRVRPRVEQVFAWIKGEGRMRQLRFRGSPKVELAFALNAAAYNILKLAKFA